MSVTISQAQFKVETFARCVLPADLTARDQFLKLVEEVGELAVGLHKKDAGLTADALGDCLYVLLGLANLSSVNLEQVFELVHASNMTKTGDGTLSPKGGRYSPPKLLCSACGVLADVHVHGTGGEQFHYCRGCFSKMDGR